MAIAGELIVDFYTEINWFLLYLLFVVYYLTILIIPYVVNKLMFKKEEANTYNL
jgi:hypothetical protein